MLKEFVDRIVALAAPYREEIGGLPYSDREITLIDAPRAEPLVFSRLRGFVDFVKNAAEGIDLARAVVHVAGPGEVRLLGTMDRLRRDREVYARAVHAVVHSRLGEFKDAETFVIEASTQVIDSPERARLLELVGNMRSEEGVEVEDDGVSQQVAVRAGVKLAKREHIANPFSLAVRRTFPEAEQPIAPVILRVRRGGQSGAQVALFECDGGAWEIDAVENIRAWLERALAETKLPILA